MINKSIINCAYHEAINLAKRIIDEYPIFGSQSQKKVAELLAQYLTENGWSSTIDIFCYSDIQECSYIRKPWEYDVFYEKYKEQTKYNVYALLDSNKPGNTIILTGHYDIDIIDKTDLSRSYRKAEVSEDGLLLGRGSTDMLSGLCSLVTISKLLSEIDWCGRVVFAAVTDEEIGGNGTIRACQWMSRNGYFNDVKVCVIAEPTENEICNETMGFLPFEIVIKSKIIHMNAQKEVSAVQKLLRIIGGIDELEAKYQGLNINYGYISGGQDPSLPIDEMLIKGVAAMRNNISIGQLKEQLKQIVGEGEVRFIDLQIEPYGNSQCANNKLFPSACDAPIFGEYNIPTIVWGPGSLEQAHTEDEYIYVSSIEEYISELFNYVYKAVME